MITRDSLDFRAWYGRAECQAKDPLVLADAQSPTGWRFRTSYQAAIRDYQHALTLVPSSHLAFRGAAFSRLSEMFFTEPNMLRRGTKGRDLRAFDFAAYASLDHDTLAFNPQEFAAVTRARPRNTITPNLGPAVAMSRRAVLQVTTEWVRAFPKSAEALASHGLALEVAGELTDGGTSTDSAQLMFRKARAAASDQSLQVQLASAELRILVKRGQYDRAERARRLAARRESLAQREGGSLPRRRGGPPRPGSAGRVAGPSGGTHRVLLGSGWPGTLGSAATPRNRARAGSLRRPWWTDR